MVKMPTKQHKKYANYIMSLGEKSKKKKKINEKTTFN